MSTARVIDVIWTDVSRILPKPLCGGDGCRSYCVVRVQPRDEKSIHDLVVDKSMSGSVTNGGGDTCPDQGIFIVKGVAHERGALIHSPPRLTQKIIEQPKFVRIVSQRLGNLWTKHVRLDIQLPEPNGRCDTVLGILVVQGILQGRRDGILVRSTTKTTESKDGNVSDSWVSVFAELEQNGNRVPVWFSPQDCCATLRWARLHADEAAHDSEPRNSRRSQCSLVLDDVVRPEACRHAFVKGFIPEHANDGPAIAADEMENTEENGDNNSNHN